MAILTSRAGGILRIEFDRPEKKNAITAAMYRALADALASAESDGGVRVVLIVGKPEIFTAGNDLEDFLHHPPHGDNSPVFQFLDALTKTTKPLVAAVRGAAVGVGTTLLLHCDLVYAATDARFSLPFVQLGLVPEAASSFLLPELAGRARAAEKLLLGEPFGADEAFRMGFVSQVLAAEDVLPHAERQAEKLARLPAIAVQATKRLMQTGRGDVMRARMKLEGEEFVARLASGEAKEAFRAFLERRKPDFTQFQQ